MKLQSCQNCWFNGLQYGVVGLSVGFCARHRVVLNIPDETTCGLQVRKDLGLSRAREVASIHANAYDAKTIVRLTTNEESGADFSSSARDISALRKDAVGEAVVDYGSLNSRIESLAQLKALKTARADLAMVSLGRAYVGNCVRQGGNWTSGIHLYWWTKRILPDIPDIQIEDIRYSGSIQLSRQIELAAWSVMMLRLSFLDDIIAYAGDQDAIGLEVGMAMRAALAVQDFSVRKLRIWIGKEVTPALDARLSYERYSSLAQGLHKNGPENDQSV